MKRQMIVCAGVMLTVVPCPRLRTRRQRRPGRRLPLRPRGRHRLASMPALRRLAPGSDRSDRRGSSNRAGAAAGGGQRTRTMRSSGSGISTWRERGPPMIRAITRWQTWLPAVSSPGIRRCRRSVAERARPPPTPSVPRGRTACSHPRGSTHCRPRLRVAGRRTHGAGTTRGSRRGVPAHAGPQTLLSVVHTRGPSPLAQGRSSRVRPKPSAWQSRRPAPVTRSRPRGPGHGWPPTSCRRLDSPPPWPQPKPRCGHEPDYAAAHLARDAFCWPWAARASDPDPA